MARRTASENRSAVLGAARAIFAEQGYDGATIRAIGERAGVDPAMVMRYFGSKEQLFAQAVDLRLDLPRLSPGLPVDDVAALIAFGIHRWDTDPALAALLRASVVNDKIADRLRAVFAGQIVTLLRDAGLECPEHRAALLTSVVFGTVMTRHLVKIEPMSMLSARELREWLTPVVAACLRGPGAH